MDAIYGQKGIKAGFTAGRPRKLILTVAKSLVRRGAEAVLAGCTEVPLVLKDKDIRVPLIDPMLIGALACIEKAGAKIKRRL
jgi:aspartate racemase